MNYIITKMENKHKVDITATDGVIQGTPTIIEEGTGI